MNYLVTEKCPSSYLFDLSEYDFIGIFQKYTTLILHRLSVHFRIHSKVLLITFNICPVLAPSQLTAPYELWLGPPGPSSSVQTSVFWGLPQ